MPSTPALARRRARSAPVRWFVLVLLRYAATVSEDYVFEAAGMPHSELDVIASDGNEPDDALRLAARFYALAAALCTLLPLGNLFDRQCEHRGLRSHAAADCGHRPSGWMLKPHDTS